MFDDPEHSEDEERFILPGMSQNANVCIVCHCYRESDTVIRIISARKATRKEQAAKVGVPYQTLINLYLTDCVNNKREIQMIWK